MTRILVGGFLHEVHTFIGGTLDLAAWRRNGYIATGAEILSDAIGSGQEIHGALAVARDAEVTIVPSLLAFGGVGPRVADDVWALLRAGIVDVARAEAGRIDGVYLSLHGAMATESEDDPEGAILAELRAILGPSVPIAATFDLHVHMTERMVRAADIVIAYRTIPHMDYVETGERAMRALLDAVAGRTRPVCRTRKLRMTASAERHDTNAGPMVAVMARARALEAQPGIIAVSVTPTQPWMDVPELGWSVTVVADGDAEAAQAAADGLARMLWARRERFLVTKVPVDAAVAAAVAHPTGPVILADGADSPSAGGNGDGNDLLRALIAAGARDALCTVVDPAAAAACHAAGTGATLTVALGGTITPGLFRPLTVTGTVVSLHDGRYRTELPVRPMDVGPTAVLAVDGVRVVVATRKAWQLDESLYHHAGLDPRTARIAVVKSAGGFRGVYAPFAAAIIEADTPGPCTHDLTRLPFRRIPRPMWPWDLDLVEPWPGAGPGGPDDAGDAAGSGGPAG